MNSRVKTIFFVLAIVVLLFLYQASFASERHNNGPRIESDSKSISEATAHSESSVESSTHVSSHNAVTNEAFGGAGGYAEGGDAYSEGSEANSQVSNEVNSDYNSESNNTNVVLVPNNNTSDCQRVYGLSFGTGNGAGALGVPYRDKACDFEQAADDAAAHGQHKVAWWWRCHKKNLLKTFKGKGDSDAMAQLKCWNSMTSMIEVNDVAEIEPAAGVEEPIIVTAARRGYDDSELMAQQQQLEDEYEQIVDKQSQLVNKLQTQDRIIRSQESEIERLKRIERERGAKAAAILQERGQ